MNLLGQLCPSLSNSQISHGGRVYPRTLVNATNQTLFFFCFLGQHPWYGEVPRLGVELEL